jgi:voltage-gated potassium channel
MSDKFGAAAALVALTLVVQCAGMALLIAWGRARFAHKHAAFGIVRSALLMLSIMANIVVLHLVEVLLWAGFYWWKCLPSWTSAFYFSAANYTTVGANDLLLTPEWRELGPLESLTGVLMCGLSASFLFAVVTRLVQHAEMLNKGEGQLMPASLRATGMSYQQKESEQNREPTL